MQVLPFIQNFGIGEWLLIILVVMLLFGATKIPELARTLGRAKGDFEKGKREGERENAAEEERDALLRKARDLGVPTEGRPLDDIRKDVQSKSA